MSLGAWLTTLAGHDRLGPQAERVVRELGRHPQFAGYASAREVAERAGVNTSTVVRTAQQLGYDGWPALRHDLRERYVSMMSSGEISLPTAPGSSDAASRMLRQDAVNLGMLSDEETVAAIRAAAATIAGARRTLVLGSGVAAAPASILGHLGTIMGYDIQLALGAATAQAAQVMQLQKGDCVIAVNVWRLTRSLRALTELAKQQGATVCVLTDLHASPLGEVADHLIVAPIEGVRSSPSMTAMVAVVQALVAELSGTLEATRATGRVEHAWATLSLMDEEE